MNAPDLKNFAYVSEDYLNGRVKAVFVNFPGLGNMEMKSSLDIPDIMLAHEGVIFVYPFVNPWNWMNDKTVKFVDGIMDIVIKKYHVGKNCPIVARGGSMGGYSALAYSMFSKHRLAAVIANCPVTDIYFHSTERPDLPRTFHDAMGCYGDISTILKDRSPNYHPEKMPDCKYLIIHGFNDKAVNKEKHSDKLVKLMKKRKLDVTYVEDDKMAHCGPMKYETVVAMGKFIDEIIK